MFTSDNERADHFMRELFKLQEEAKTLRDKIAGLERENASLRAELGKQ